MAARSTRSKRAPTPNEPHVESAGAAATLPASADASRREAVLEAAVELVSNHGIAGMSLRMLARKLGMQQPSLYHYFDSKDALVDQIVEYCAGNMAPSAMLDRLPDLPLEKLPFFLVERTLELWQTERYVRFARFLFVVSIESPKHRPMIRRVFEERLYGSAAADIAHTLGDGALGDGALGDGALGDGALGDGALGDGADAERFTLSLRMLASALGLALMHERVLCGLEAPSEETLHFARFMAESVARLLTEPA